MSIGAVLKIVFESHNSTKVIIILNETYIQKQKVP